MAEEARQIVILGVGNRLRGDDAVGCLVCDELMGEGHDPIRLGESGSCPRPEVGDSPPGRQDVESTAEVRSQISEVRMQKFGVPDSGGLGGCSPRGRVCVIDCGNTPENYIQPVVDRSPERILVVDCCDYGAKPGEFRLFNRAEIEQLSYGLLSTHTLPLTLTIEMLSIATKAEIELLGIQPERIEFGEVLSPAVQSVLPVLVDFVRSWARS